MKSFLFLPLLFLSSSFDLSAQAWGEYIPLPPTEWSGGDSWGKAMDLEGSRALLGASSEQTDENGTNWLSLSGAVYFYQENSQGNWVQIQKLLAQDRASGDQFGWAIQMQGNLAFIGAPFHDQDIVGSPAQADIGAVYIFQQSPGGNWQQVQKLVASDRKAYDFFGYSLAFDDSLAIIGAFGKDNGGPGGLENNWAGGAYVFERDSAGVWTEVAILSAADTALTDFYGYAVSISGTTAVVGAPQEDEDEVGANTLLDPGAAYVYDRLPNGQWSLSQKLVANDRGWTYEQLGHSISIRKDELVLSSPGKRVQDSSGGFFNRAGELAIWRRDSSGIFHEAQKLHPPSLVSGIRLGFNPNSLDLTEDHLLAGGARAFGRTGSAYLFQKDSTGNWGYQYEFSDPEGKNDDYYGWSVAFDTATILIGSYGKGLANPIYNYAGKVFFYRPCAPRFTPLSDSLCAGDSFFFAGQWRDVAGFYTDSLLAASGCDSTTTLSLFFHPPVETSLSQSDTSLTALASGAAFQWLSCTNGLFQPIPGASGATFEPAISGWYTVAISQFGSCTDTSDCVEMILPSTGLKADFARQMLLFPNPTTGHLQLRFPEPPTQLHVRILDLHGRLLSEHQFSGQAEVEFSIPGPAGMYLLDLRDANGERVLRRVVKW